MRDTPPVGGQRPSREGLGQGVQVGLLYNTRRWTLPPLLWENDTGRGIGTCAGWGLLALPLALLYHKKQTLAATTRKGGVHRDRARECSLNNAEAEDRKTIMSREERYYRVGTLVLLLCSWKPRVSHFLYFLLLWEEAV